MIDGNHSLEQYRNDIFDKLSFDFVKGKKILDLGCGDGSDSKYFINKFNLDTYGVDIYEHNLIKNIKGLTFKKGTIYKLPFQDSYFDYVFLHDVLHHIDEPEQRYKKHKQGLEELKRITKKGGYIIIVEGNRYNPLFYPHMVKMLGHNHFTQRYFIKLVNSVFNKSRFKFFEAHCYPHKYLWFWKTYEKIMEKYSPQMFLAYNIALINR